MTTPFVPDIAIINASTVVTDADAQAMLGAVQTQVVRDFGPAWRTNANLHLVPHGAKPPKAMWWIALLDNADQAGALGYHDLTQQGLPLGKVFAKTSLQFGEPVSVVLSHETLEMLADPWINMVAQGAGDVFYAREVCDPVEADVYMINGLPVSNFVLGAYFHLLPRVGPFDQMGQLHDPMPGMTPGGYILVYRPGIGWTQIFGQPRAATTEALADQWHQRPHSGSRRERRRYPRYEWLRSSVETA